MTVSRRISLSFLLVITSSISIELKAQQIVDPCFASIEPIGRFTNSEDIINVCKCDDTFYSADLIEWDGTKWLGTLTDLIDLQPPEGCNIRAMWVGYQYWTKNGEAFAMRLDKPLEAGKTYSYTFTYAKDGNGDFDEFDSDNFSPIVYTDGYKPSLIKAFMVGRLAPAVGWETNTITFTAQSGQAGHDWLILHGVESSGIILSNCILPNPLPAKFLEKDTTLCDGTVYKLEAVAGNNYSYHWNTGDTTQFILVNQPGHYSVDVDYYKCTSSDSVNISYEDCEVRLTMPNVFTPNGDEQNPSFIPIEYNYLESGVVHVYNRWGEKVFSGDMFIGWDGKSSGSDTSTGVYFYEVLYIDRKGYHYQKRGIVTLLR